MWLPLLLKISSEKIGDKPYFIIFGQSFIQMDEDTHPHLDKSGRPVSGKPGTQINWLWKKCDCTGPVDTFLIGSVYSCQS